MAEKKTNPIVSMLSHIAMGIGGGLTGQDYLGTFYKWKESQKEKEPSDFDKYMQTLTAERGGEQGIVGGTGELSDSIQMQDLTPQNRDVATLAQEGARDFEDFRRTGRPQLKREFGTEGKAFMGRDPLDVIDYKAGVDIATTGAKEKIKEMQKLSSSLKTGEYNFNLIGENVYDLANIYSDALDEGSVGNVYKNKFSDLAMVGTFGSDLQSKFDTKPKMPGKITEILTKMMPMLTQQIGKEGSVRLVTTVFDALKKTVSEGQFNASQTKGMMQETIRSMYRVVRALDNLGVNADVVKGKGSGFEGFVLKAADNIKIVGKEKEALDKFMNEALSPLDKHINGKAGKQTKADKEYEEYLAIIGE